MYATALAHQVRNRGGYDVDVPDLADAEWVPAEPFDAVITSLPVPREWGDVIIELPDSFDAPVIVTVADVSAPVRVDPLAPIDDVVSLLVRYVPADIAVPPD